MEEGTGPFKAGAPFKFSDVASLNLAIQAYFDSCDPHVQRKVVDTGINQQGETTWGERAVMTPQKPYTMSGLARALGVSRTTLTEYSKPEHYSDQLTMEVRQGIMASLANAKRRVEEFAESQLFEGNANGAKFNLTNNHGWVEKTVQEHEGGFFGQGGRLEVEIVNPEPTPDDPAQAETEPDPEPGPTPTS